MKGEFFTPCFLMFHSHSAIISKWKVHIQFKDDNNEVQQSILDIQ